MATEQQQATIGEFARIVEIPVGRLQRAFKSFDYFETYHDVNIPYERLWVAILITGGLLGAIYGGMELFFRWLYDKRLEAMIAVGSVWSGLGIWQAISLSIILTVAVGILKLAPLAAGSGVSEMYGALNGLIFPHLLRLKTNVVKSVGLMLTLSTGLWVGPEAPMIQIGGSVALRVGEFMAEGRRHLSDKEKYDLISMGGTMGLAAAFRAPLSGVTLMVEGFALLWHHALVWPALCGVWIASYVSGLFITEFSGSGSMFGTEGDGVYRFESEVDTVVNLLTEVGILATSAFLGVYGAVFARLTEWLEVKVGNLGKVSKVLFTLIVCAVTFTSFAGFSIFARNLFEGPHNEAILDLMSPRNTQATQDDQLVVYIMFFFSVAIQSLLIQFTPLPVGIFAPHIALGAAVGRFFAVAIGGGHSHIVAVCGAASGLVSYFRFPVTVAVLMTELTSDVYLSLPVLHAIIVTKLIADRLGRGRTALDALVQGKGLPVLRDATPKHRELLKDVSIGSRASRPAVVLPEIVDQETVKRVLSGNPHLYYPVVRQDGTVLGAVLRSRLVREVVQMEELTDLGRLLDHPPVIVDDNTEFLKAYRIFREKGVRRLIVVEHESKVISGILTRSDFFRVFYPP